MKTGSRRRRSWSRWVLGLVVIVALVGLVYTPHPPSAQDFRGEALAGPSWAHWMGVDPNGRDLFSRLWRGTGNTLLMSLGAVVGSLVLSSLLLALEEGGGRRLAGGVRALVNLWVAFPVFFIGLLLLVWLRASPGVLVLAAALGNVPLAFRQLRVLWREQRHAMYVEASEVLGASRAQLFRHTIWPNLWPDVAALGKLVFAISALELSGLAFLGLIGDPDFPELGTLLKQHLNHAYEAPHLVLWPGLILSGLLALVHSTELSASSR